MGRNHSRFSATESLKQLSEAYRTELEVRIITYFSKGKTWIVETGNYTFTNLSPPCQHSAFRRVIT